MTWLIRQGVKFIFYPCIPYERTEFEDSVNHYNCPIVTSYAENIKNNVDELNDDSIIFRNPFMAFTNEKVLTERLVKEFPDIPDDEIRKAAHEAWLEQDAQRKDIMRKGEETLTWMEQHGRHGIVLAGRPYHIDPEIHHGIPDLINSYGVAVLTEDAVSHLAPLERPIRVNDQWMYHTRLYAAANFVKEREDLDLIQLNSFGCGLDAVTTDEVSEILMHSGKIYTCLKIDEVNNLGAARIRVRSCSQQSEPVKILYQPDRRAVFHREGLLHERNAEDIYHPVSADVTDPFQDPRPGVQRRGLPAGSTAK